MNGLAYDLGCREEYTRQEMIGGKLYMMAGPTTNHVKVSGNIFREFANHFHGKTCEVYGDGMTVYFTDKDYVVPDMTVVCDKSKIKTKGIYGAPDLVVEVLSPGSQKRDLNDKLKLYERHGVKEYWVVGTTDKSVKVYLPVEGRYELTDVHIIYPDYELEDMTEEEKAAIVMEFSPEIFPDMKIALDDIFHGLIE
jgi:Uma2 family endonuclease